jgi:glycosyltransferase involved in cell wall biosynthesis
MSGPPLVSIGLPVYNGEAFLGRALDTLLAQKMGDFEVVISDNASTDATEEICRSYEAVDQRIRYVRQERNRGAAWNFTHVFDLADPGARYVKWAAADDEHAPEFLDETVAMLEADPTAALAHTGTADIDAEGYVVKVWHQPVSHLSSVDPAERLWDLVTLNHECFGAFGLIRHEVARATRGLGAYSDADNVFLVEIALRGKMIHSDEVRFFRRQHPARSTVAFPTARGRAAWFDSDLVNRLEFPTWRIGRELVRAVRDAPLTATERQRCYRSMGVFVRNNWQGMAKNVVRSTAEAPSVLPRRYAKAVFRGRATTGGSESSAVGEIHDTTPELVPISRSEPVGAWDGGGTPSDVSGNGSTKGNGSANGNTNGNSEGREPLGLLGELRSRVTTTANDSTE